MSPVSTVKTLQIDGRDVTGRHDETILDVARQNKIFIPRLCEMDGLSDVGACRLWRNGSASPMCTFHIAIQRKRSTHRTIVSSSITIDASCALGAGACAMKSRVRTPGMSWAVASTPKSSPT